MSKLPKSINKMTQPELDKYIELCNFSENELEYFKLKSKGKSIVQISMIMCVSESTVSNYSKRVRDKMLSIL